MRRLVSIVAVVLCVGALVFGGMVFGSHGGNANAENAKSGPWKAIVTYSVCSGCDVVDVAPDQMKDMSNLDSISEAGDPNGSPMYVVNVVTKLEQDGCEWQWMPQGVKIAILYRC